MTDINKKTSLSMLNVEEQLNLLKAILESSTEYSIIAFDLDQHIVAWNVGAANIYGYEASEVVHKEFSLILTDDDKKSGKINSVLKEVRQKAKWTGEMQRVCKDGSIINVFATFTLRKDANNQPVGYTVISRDLTSLQTTLKLLNKVKASEALLKIKNAELEETIHQAQEANRLKGEFLANVSHELRTPLNGIIGFAELMYDGLVEPSSPKFMEFLKDIIISAKHLLSIINDVLDHAKLEAGKMKFYPELVDLNELIKTVSDNFLPLIIEKSIQYDVQIDPLVGDIVIDSERLKQVVYNYLSNAFKFTPKDGSITVRVTADEENTFRLEVIDTGIGIRPNDIKKLFVKFQQLESSANKEYAGTGLGLALTANIVEAQGGRVGVHSIFKKGSNFYAILPRFPSPKFIEGPVQKSSITHQTPKLLLVEHASDERKLTVKALIQAGYEIVTASNAVAAREYTNKNTFNAVILDLFLSEMTNWEIIQNFKSKNAGSEMNQLIIASVMIEHPITVGFRIHDFLIKPIKSEELFTAIKGVGIFPYNNKSILVVDHNPLSLSCAEILVEYGYKVICKQSKSSALLAWEQESPDVILVDPFTSEMDGFEFLNSLHQLNDDANVPIIIWTEAKHSDEQRTQLKLAIQHVVLQSDNMQKAVLAGIEDYLPPVK